MRRDRDRDAAIDRMLGAGLRGSAGAADACPQAGELAALVEGGLSRAERDTIERHAAACERCQRALALIGSVSPAATPASHAPRHVVWLRWAIPATGVAAVVFLYISLRSMMLAPEAPGAVRPVAAPASQEQPRLADSVVAATPPVLPQPATSTERGHAEAAKPSARTRGTSDATREKGRPAGTARLDAPAPAGVAGQIAATQNEARLNALVQVAPDVANNAAVLRQEAPAQRQTQVQQQASAQQPRQEQVQIAPVAAPPAAAPVGANRPQPVAAASGQPPTAAKALATGGLDRVQETVVISAPPPIIVAPDGSVRWRLEPSGGISRSRDRGDTWQLQAYRAASTLLAGSAPAPTVCWLVGGAGTVVVTTDGERWTSRPFPERVDLIAMGARDALHATVTTRDGRRFTTDDGGASWRQTQ